MASFNVSGVGAVRSWWCSLVLVGACAVSSAAAAEATDLGLIREDEYAARFASEVQPLWATRVKQGHFVGVGGIKLAYAAVDVPDERAAVVIVTGRTENFLKYQEVVADLVRQGYSAYVYDHRGQGFSERLLSDEREKGHVRRFDDYVDDLQTFVDKVVRKAPNRRLFVLAHSMGGGVATRHLERFPGTFAAAALSSPMHQPNATIIFSPDSSCGWFKFTGWAFSESWAGFTPKPYSHGPYDAKTNTYTHSPVRWAKVLQVENEHPEVRLGGPTRGWASEACSASAQMIAQASKIKTPVLVLQAGEDDAVVPDGQDQFCAALAQGSGAQCDGGKPLPIEGARHELLIEADVHRVRAMTAILGFFARQH